MVKGARTPAATEKLPLGEKELALNASQNYEKRIKEDTYYEEES